MSLFTFALSIFVLSRIAAGCYLISESEGSSNFESQKNKKIASHDGVMME